MAMTLEQLKDAIDKGEIDTVVVAAVDMQAGLKGRQMTARHFLQESVAHSKMNISTYFLTSTIEGMPADGYEIGSWEQGFNDCHLIPDLGTIRRTPWVEATALVIADPQHKLTAEPLYCSPRVILRQQVQRLAQRGLKGLFASELEFHLFAESRESARQKRWQGLQPGQPHWQWMNVGVSAPTEPFMRRVRNQLEAAGILMEATHPEYAPSQQELNFVPAAPLEMADRHILTKQAIHELARQAGLSATFMAKYSSTLPGSSCHIHMSLQNADTGKSVFCDPADKEFGMSQLMRHWLAGLIKYAPECTIFFAPYLNSYKRMQPNSFAPTKRCWAVDNRTSAFRLCAEQSSSVHVEVRVGGADLNPYLAYAALIAAGLAGLDEELPLEPPAEGNIYSKAELPDLPHSLREATVELAQGKMLPNAFGEKAVKHYLNAARHEQAEFDKQVTDWELMRGFDRC